MTEEEKDPNEWIQLKQAAEELGKDRHNLARWAKAGRVAGAEHRVVAGSIQQPWFAKRSAWKAALRPQGRPKKGEGAQP